MFLETNKCFSQVKEVYDAGLYAPTLSSTWTKLLSSSQALKECGELRLVPVQRMAKLHHRQMRTSHLWFASASTLGQFLHSSSIKAHICNKAGSKCEQEDDRVHQLAINTDLSWINSYVILKWLEDAYDSYTRDIVSGGHD